MMKKVFALTLALLLILAAVGCGQQNTPPSESGTPDSTSQIHEQTADNIHAGGQADAAETEAPVSCDFEAAVAWANWSDDTKIRDLALNKDTFAQSLALHLPIYKCSTQEELNDFKAAFSGIFTLDSAWDEVPSFEDVRTAYTEDFFAENDLFLVYVETGSCTPRFGVASVSKENGTLCVTVERTYDPEVGDCAMAGWLMAVTVSKEQTRDCSNFDAVLQ